MYGSIEGLVRSGLTKDEQDKGIEEIFLEERSYDWWITYYIYKDKVEVLEYMDGNSKHCRAIAADLDEAMLIASLWL